MALVKAALNMSAFLVVIPARYASSRLPGNLWLILQASP